MVVALCFGQCVSTLSKFKLQLVVVPAGSPGCSLNSIAVLIHNGQYSTYDLLFTCDIGLGYSDLSRCCGRLHSIVDSDSIVKAVNVVIAAHTVIYSIILYCNDLSVLNLEGECAVNYFVLVSFRISDHVACLGQGVCTVCKLDLKLLALSRSPWCTCYCSSLAVLYGQHCAVQFFSTCYIKLVDSYLCGRYSLSITNCEQLLAAVIQIISCVRITVSSTLSALYVLNCAAVGFLICISLYSKAYL